MRLPVAIWMTTLALVGCEAAPAPEFYGVRTDPNAPSGVEDEPKEESLPFEVGNASQRPNRPPPGASPNRAPENTPPRDVPKQRSGRTEAPQEEAPKTRWQGKVYTAPPDCPECAPMTESGKTPLNYIVNGTGASLQMHLAWFDYWGGGACVELAIRNMGSPVEIGSMQLSLDEPVTYTERPSTNGEFVFEGDTLTLTPTGLAAKFGRMEVEYFSYCSEPVTLPTALDVDEATLLPEDIEPADYDDPLARLDRESLHLDAYVTETWPGGACVSLYTTVDLGTVPPLLELIPSEDPTMVATTHEHLRFEEGRLILTNPTAVPGEPGVHWYCAEPVIWPADFYAP